MANHDRQPCCSRHPQSDAVWRCEGCHTDLCPDCVVKAHDAARGHHRCAHCGSRVQWLYQPRETRPWFSLLGVYTRNLLRPDALLLLFLTAGGLYLGEWALGGVVEALSTLFTLVFFTGFFAFCVFASTHGAFGLPRLTPEDGAPVRWGPALRYACSGAHGWLVVSMYVLLPLFGQGPWFDLPLPALYLDWPTWVAIGAVSALAPGAALTTAIAGHPTFETLSPPRLRGIYLTVPLQYLQMSLGVAAGLILSCVLIPRALWHLKYVIPVAFLADFVAATLSLVAPTVLAFALGRFVHDNLPALGWEGVLDHPNVADTDIVPTGTYSKRAADYLHSAGLGWQLQGQPGGQVGGQAGHHPGVPEHAPAAPDPAPFLPTLMPTAQNDPDESLEDGIPLADMTTAPVRRPSAGPSRPRRPVDNRFTIPLANAPAPAHANRSDTSRRPTPPSRDAPANNDDELFVPLDEA